MIFYGTNGKHFATLDLPHQACPACRSAGQLQVGLVSQYAHVYWIPFFPYQKAAVVLCGRCGESWKHNAWPPELAPAVRDLQKQASHPIWTWTGLGLVALLMLVGYVMGVRNDRADEALLVSPKAGDIYTVRSDSANMYSLLKVLRVSGNGVELVANEFQTSDSSPINSLNEASRYSKEPFVITRLDLQIMRRKGELTDVERP